MKVGKTRFSCSRGRMFDEGEAHSLADKLLKCKQALVFLVTTKSTYKQRPLPLNTVEAQKLVSQKLRISPAKCMETMERLYNRGFLSYPRTETNIYHPSINLNSIVEQLKQDVQFGFGHFAEALHSGE